MTRLIKRSIYLGYYLKNLDWGSFNRYFSYTKDLCGLSTRDLWLDIIKSVYRYNISLMDYFVFRFFEKDPVERVKWVGTGYKYEFDLIMNPKASRSLLADKIAFYEAYRPFVRHSYCTIGDLKNRNQKGYKVLQNSTGRIVVKDSLGQCGFEVEVVESKDLDIGNLITFMTKRGYDLAEEYIEQVPLLKELSPSGLNTIRIITQLGTDGEVHFLGARLRVSINSHVDNLASGNMAAPIDLDTGIVTGKGVFSDITKNALDFHPITQVKIVGFRIPCWDEILTVARNAALHRPENRSIGWDLAITKSGITVIEGNHNWCKILWQIPINMGLRDVLDEYL